MIHIRYTSETLQKQFRLVHCLRCIVCTESLPICQRFGRIPCGYSLFAWVLCLLSYMQPGASVSTLGILGDGVEDVGTCEPPIGCGIYAVQLCGLRRCRAHLNLLCYTFAHADGKLSCVHSLLCVLMLLMSCVQMRIELSNGCDRCHDHFI